jgi:hypothetical protein
MLEEIADRAEKIIEVNTYGCHVGWFVMTSIATPLVNDRRGGYRSAVNNALHNDVYRYAQKV